MTGALHGLGAGPGDPELITLKAHRLLRAADAVAYPAPPSGDSLARQLIAPHLPGTQPEVPLTIPFGADAESAYDDAARVLGTWLNTGAAVALACEGDPFLYGTFIHLHARLAHRYPVHVVPGVSAVTACAATSATALVARGETLTVLPATLPAATLRARLHASDAAVLLKLGRHFAKARDILGDLGLLARAVYIERATMAGQAVQPLAQVDPGRVPYFAAIVVPGEAA